VTVLRDEAAKDEGKPSSSFIKSLLSFSITFILMFSTWLYPLKKTVPRKEPEKKAL